MKQGKKKVGIMGGTFNPIHLGHLVIAQSAYEEFDLDEVLFVPSGCSYMKEQTDILDAKTRVSITGLAIEDNPKFALSTIEIDRDGNSYSYETLETLKKQNPDTEYYFIVGADTLFALETWKHPEIFIPSCTILAAVRFDVSQEDMKKQADFLMEKYGGHIELLHTKHLDISSSDIRKRLHDGKEVRYFLPDAVLHYIKKNHLYLGEKD